ncbi:hypothetical protein [Tropicimonas sp. IMCC34043]|uniref:hypothetical protein n=1 Tax=Tropicimonas sp. IMCC34043 TaxID=2248760 RepID=UPI0013003CE3|nr:hypothetical protein [Tropicimonas sp. IMCC34043]
MSTGTLRSRLRAAALIGAVALTFAASGANARRAGFPDATMPSLPTRVSVPDRSVVISAPTGYCVDTGATQTGGTFAFVLLASCQVVTGDPLAPGPVRPGLLTASVGSEASASLPATADLDRYFASDRGRATLSRKGDPADVTSGPSFARAGAFYIHAHENGPDPVTGGHSWRAIFAVNGRLVTVTLRDLLGYPMSDAEAFQTVEGFAEQIMVASQANFPHRH